VRIAFVSGDDVIVEGSGDPGDECGRLCAALAARGHQVTAYVRRRDQRSPEISTDHGYRIVTMCAGPAEAVSPPEVLPFVGDWAAELDRRWSSDPPDIVHAEGWLGGLTAQLAARRQQVPTVQSFRGLAATMESGPGTRNTERARLEPLLVRNAAWVTGGSSAEVDALARLRHSRARLSVLATGVDVERYVPAGPERIHNDPYRVLCLEQNPLRCNGFDTMIRIMPRLPGAELVIAETAAADCRHDQQRAGLKRLAAELGVRDRVRFLGTVVGDELPTLLRSADVVACTPRQSPRATTALQAMASGVVVVAVAVGSLSDTVVHGVTGLLPSPNKPDELVAALKALQMQRFQRESMAAAGRSRAVSRFTWDRIALDARNIYEKTISQHLPNNKLAATRSQSTSGEHRVAVR